MPYPYSIYNQVLSEGLGGIAGALKKQREREMLMQLLPGLLNQTRQQTVNVPGAPAVPSFRRPEGFTGPGLPQQQGEQFGNLREATPDTQTTQQVPVSPFDMSNLPSLMRFTQSPEGQSMLGVLAQAYKMNQPEFKTVGQGDAWGTVQNGQFTPGGQVPSKVTPVYKSRQMTGPDGKPIFEKIPGTDDTRAVMEEYDVNTGIAVPNSRTLDTGGSAWHPPMYLQPQIRRGRVIDKFNTDAQTQRYRTMISSANVIRTALDTDNPIAQQSVLNQMVKMSGDVGMITESDREQFGGSKAILDRINAIAEEWKSGKLSATNRKWLQELTAVYDKAGRENLYNHADTYAGQQSLNDAELGDRDSIRNILLSGNDPRSPVKPSGGMQTFTVDGKTYQVPDADVPEFKKDMGIK